MNKLIRQLALIGYGLACSSVAAMAEEMPPLHVKRTGVPAVVDSQGRTTLLRGVNLNALGDYFQANPLYPTVIDATEDDFAQMSALGLNVVRLILSWSSLEPERGVIDESYIDRIKTMVGYAKKYGIYVVLDMHQDAWGKFIASSPDTQCGFFESSIGWDGAPKWATYTDGASTCRVKVREFSPAVARAFENFWRNREGIQTELISVWSRLATAFADEPAVVGYDLINEPNFGVSVGLSQTLLMGRYYTQALRAIRSAEKSVTNGFSHVAFVEPSVEWSAFGVTLPPLGLFLLDDNIVFAPHLYAGSITVTGTITSGYQAASKVATLYRTPFWSGEWGWFGEPAQTEPQIWAYAQQEDAYRIGGAVWQWKQACGDPHSQGVRNGREVVGEQYQVTVTLCPGDTALGVSPAYARVLSRARPLHAPGDLVALSSDPYRGVMTLEGRSEEPGALVLWVPAQDYSVMDNGTMDKSSIGKNSIGKSRTHSGPPVVSGGSELVREKVSGGYRITLNVSGNYQVRVDY